MTRNGVLNAAQSSILLADNRRNKTLNPAVMPEGTGWDHLVSMLQRMQEGTEESMSIGKLNRWLGWMQASLTAAGWLTLEESKSLNMRHRDD